MKLIRCFIVFVVISFILGVGSAFNGSTTNVDNAKEKDVSTEIVDKNENEIAISTNSVEKEEITPVIEEEKTFDNQKQVEKASEIKTSIDKGEVNNSQSQIEEKRGENKQLMVQEKVEQTHIAEQENNVLKEESNVIDQVIVKEEKREEKIDYEYEALLKQVEYSSFDECMNVGFEEAIKDPIGILGFSCPYIAYKGEIIGYRLQLDYTNPMEN